METTIMGYIGVRIPSYPLRRVAYSCRVEFLSWRSQVWLLYLCEVAMDASKVSGAVYLLAGNPVVCLFVMKNTLDVLLLQQICNTLQTLKSLSEESLLLCNIEI